jgi:hypothetical protein
LGVVADDQRWNIGDRFAEVVVAQEELRIVLNVKTGEDAFEGVLVNGLGDNDVGNQRRLKRCDRASSA